MKKKHRKKKEHSVFDKEDNYLDDTDMFFDKLERIR